jgi:hypothetical protein
VNQNQQTGKRIVAVMALVGLGVLAGCASGASGAAASGQSVYRCDNGLEFTARFLDDSVVLKSARAEDVLLRDAGGQGEQEPVFSSARLRAQFGLGASAREARLKYAESPLAVRCQRG